MSAAREAETDAADRSHEGLGHMLWEVSARATMLGEAALAGTPLTLPGAGLLEQIAAEPGITIAEISRRVPKTQQAISQVAARLERLGYLERRLGRGRGVGLYITTAGIAAQTEGQRLQEGFERDLRKRLGEDRYEQLLSLLEQANQLLTD